MKLYVKYLLFIGILACMTMYISTVIQGNKPIKEEPFALQYLVREPKDATKNKAPVLVLLHGYGSNEKDLFSLSNQIPDNWLVVSVRAPFTLGENKFKWYSIQIIDKEIIMNFVDEEKSRKLLLTFIDQFVLKYKADKNKIVTAGFSQGGNMALGLALTEPDKIFAAGCFSGHFMEEIKPLIKDKETLESKQVFIAHGTKDPLVPIQSAKENRDILEGWEMNVTLSTDKIAHSISGKQLKKFVEWMKLL